ncbi:hypothetical protein PGRAT_15645 [Paenibacillus graminis]|uniref:Uncharacterized protein n=1 Tax=Paenibacillus graminis TaxID=189425 RepID=A0A089MBT5_9BACL|nr:hypothetical protein PGRAT_15645 [Paenibacillus graminis]
MRAKAMLAGIKGISAFDLTTSAILAGIKGISAFDLTASAILESKVFLPLFPASALTQRTSSIITGCRDRQFQV